MKKGIAIGIVIGILISGVVVCASTLLKASDVLYNDTTVKDSLDNLFNDSLTGKNNIITALSSKGFNVTNNATYNEIVSSINSFKNQPFFFYKVGSTTTQGTVSFTIDVSSVDKIYYKYLIGPYSTYNSNSYTTVVSTKDMIASQLSEPVGMVSSYNFWSCDTYSLDVSDINEISISITDHNDSASTGARYSQYMILLTDFDF